MYYFIIALIIIAAVLLVFFVLIQRPKGGGIASNFSSANQIIGVKKTTDFIEKATWGLAIAIMILTLSSNFFVNRGTAESGSKAINREQIDATPVTPPPGAPVQQQQTQPAQNAGELEPASDQNPASIPDKQ